MKEKKTKREKKEKQKQAQPQTKKKWKKPLEKTCIKIKKHAIATFFRPYT